MALPLDKQAEPPSGLQELQVTQSRGKEGPLTQRLGRKSPPK